jgi:hypothetical protein
MKLRPARARRVRLPDGGGWDVADPRTGLPVFGHLAHGVLLDWLGAEGSIVAHGHVPLRVFAKACEALAERDGCPAPTADWIAFTEDVRRVWAVHAFASDPIDWRLHWDGVDAGTPGAFPVTIFGTGW